jgi:hypothetical protein
MEIDLNIEGADPAAGRVKARLGIIADAGYQPFPNLLLLHQNDLGLNSSQLNVLANIMMHRHNSAVLPFPHTKTIAARMGIEPRSVQAIIRQLIDGGFMIKVKGSRRGEPAAYDIRPVLKKLETYAKQRIALVGERSFDEMPPGQLEAIF